MVAHLALHGWVPHIHYHKSKSGKTRIVVAGAHKMHPRKDVMLAVCIGEDGRFDIRHIAEFAGKGWRKAPWPDNEWADVPAIQVALIYDTIMADNADRALQGKRLRDE